jgi:flagellar biosynthesis/type III secretory pathway protein FliH
MSAAVKYLFERSFETQRGASSAKMQFDSFDEDHRFRAADLAAAREAAFAEGRMAGLAEAQSGIESAAAAALEHLAASMEALFADRDAAIEALRRDAARVAVATARAVAAGLLAGTPGSEVEALLAQSLPDLDGQARIAVRLSPAALAVLAPRLERIAEAAGFGGRIDLVADSARGDQDCAIEWSGGGVERDDARIARAIETALVNYIAEPTAPNPAPAASDSEGQ